MNRTRTNDRSSDTRTRTGGSAGRGNRFGSSAQSRSAAPGRSASPSRSGGYGRRPAAVQGEFTLPRTITPALPAVQAFA
ncbi:ATP-dependent helicase, partial [Streptomyces sp. NPDC006551]